MARRVHSWGRSQKYHDRPRYLYALLFDNGCCYIGQSVDPRDRLRQHRSPEGGWAGAVFNMIPLGVVMGTFKDGEDHEAAWRVAAARAGWSIYGKPGVLVNPYRRMTWHRHLLALTQQWPAKHRRRSRWLAWWPVYLIASIALGLAAL